MKKFLALQENLILEMCGRGKRQLVSRAVGPVRKIALEELLTKHFLQSDQCVIQPI